MMTQAPIITKAIYRQLLAEAIEAAYMKLSPAEADEIDEIAKYAQDSLMKRKAGFDQTRPSGFGDVSAIELIAKVGIWLIENQTVIRKPEGE